jgi:urease accessory protein
VRAEAIVEVEHRDGHDVVTRLRSDPPLSLRSSGDIVHLVGSGAGPVGGDDLVLRIRVGPGATLTVASVAASMVFPGPDGEVSRLRLEADVAAGGHLAFLPEPQILVRGADHEMRTTIRLGAGASLRWRDETVLGRHHEAGGSLWHRVRVDLEGRPLLRSDLALGPRWPASLGPGGVDGAGAVGTELWVGLDPAAGLAVGPLGSAAQPPADPTAGAAADTPARAERLELGRGAVVVSAVGGSARSVRSGLASAGSLCVRALLVTT